MLHGAEKSLLDNGRLKLAGVREESGSAVAELISENGANANNVRVELSLEQGGSRLSQALVPSVDIVHERPTPFKLPLPAALAAGDYTLRVLVLNNADQRENASFTATIKRGDGATGSRVQAESGWSLSVVVPAASAAGETINLKARVIAAQKQTNGLIDLEVYDERGQKVFQKFIENQTWTAGEARELAASWTPERPGNYVARVGVFSDGWSQTLAWQNEAAQFSVRAEPVPMSKPSPAATSVALESLRPGSKFYVDPNNDAKKQADAWRQARPADAALMDKMANVATARWLGDWNAKVEQDARATVEAAKRSGGVPAFVLYNIPQRDCGSYSAGGANNPAGYRAWIESVVRGLSGQTLVVLEPDALTLTDCLSQADRTARFELIKFAVEKLKAAGALVYLDAGHSSWVAAGEMAERLNAAGIAGADGFALNTSNFRSTEENTRYGEAVSKLTGGKHFIIDTSRNGNGSNGGEWCNPAGRALGTPTTTNTGHELIDALIWLKPPGQSDGACNGGPSAGTWWSEYALGLASRAKF